MFSKVVGRKCRDQQCRLAGQLQDPALVICPECGGDLVPDAVSDRRAQAVLTAATAVVGLCAVIFGYGFAVKRLSPWRTAEWLVGRIQITDSFQPREASDWIEGDAVFYSQTAESPRGRDRFLYQMKDGKRTSTFRTPLTAGTRMKFDVTPAPAVPRVYILHEDDDGGMVLFPGNRPSGDVTGPISIPDEQHLIALQGGPTTERFVVIAARKPLQAIEDLVAKSSLASGEIGRAVESFEKDPDAYVLHVDIPHQ